MKVLFRNVTQASPAHATPPVASRRHALPRPSAMRQMLRRAVSYCVPRSWLMIDGRRRPSPALRFPAAGPSPRCRDVATHARPLAVRTRDAVPPVMLTFDDGPHPEHTPRLLDALAAAGFRATFFVVGERVQRHPDVVRQIHAAGHEVANHTYTHSEPQSTSWRRFRDELRRTNALLEDLIGAPVLLMRPPKGSLTPAKLLAAWSLGLTVVLWSCDPRDYRITHTAEIERWLTTYAPRCGDIVLLHDVHPWAAHAVNWWRSHGSLWSLPVGEWIGRPQPAEGRVPSERRAAAEANRHTGPRRETAHSPSR